MKLTTLATAWLAGLALAYLWYDADPTPALLLALAALVLALLCRRLRLSPWPALLFAFLLLGLWRYETTDASAPSLILRSDGPAALRGRISNDPESTSTRVKFWLEVSAIDHRPDSPWLEKGRWEQASGKILVYAHPPPQMTQERQRPYFRYGDRLELNGRLQKPEPFDDFDYPAYLENLGIEGILWAQKTKWQSDPRAVEDSAGPSPTERFRAGLYDLRRRLAQGLEASLPPSQGALAQAMLLGLRGQLSTTVVENFRQTGTSHLLALSGLHLGILLAAALGLLRGLLGRGSYLPLVLTFLLIWLYVGVSGAPASLVRAALMGSLYLGVLVLGRPRNNLMPTLAFSAWAMTAFDPLIVTQISFQLSFAAMAGILLALPWQAAISQIITSRFSDSTISNNRWIPWIGTVLRWLASGIIISLGATLATFPLVAFNFQQLPLLGIPATILAAPLLPFALIGALMAALAGLLHPVLGQLIGLLASIPLTALLELTRLIPAWTVSGDWDSVPLVWTWYVTLILILLLAGRFGNSPALLGRLLRRNSTASTNPPQAAQPGASGPGHPINGGAYFALLGLGVILILSAAYLLIEISSGADDKLRVYFFDVGQGDSILIVTPQGKQVLVDGGPEVNSALIALDGPLPLWDRSLDLMAVTHLDADHSRGLLRALETYRVGAVLAGVPNVGSSLYPQWRKTLEQEGHTPVYLTAGQTIVLEESITLEVLHPPNYPLGGSVWNVNNTSLVLRLVYEELRFLLAGDIEATAERYLINAAASGRLDLTSQVLKVAHHGSKSSTTAAFLQAVNPQWAVISAGADNAYGHPHPSVIGRLEKKVGETGIYQTARHGVIEFSTDGEGLWVKTEK